MVETSDLKVICRNELHAMLTLETEPRLTAPTEDNALSCCDISPDAILDYIVNHEWLRTVLLEYWYKAGKCQP